MALCAVSAMGFETEKRNYLPEFKSAADTTLRIDRAAGSVLAEAVEVRASFPSLKERDGLAAHFYTLTFHDRDSDDALTVEFHHGTDAYGFSMERQFVQISARRLRADGNTTELYCEKIYTGLNFGPEANTLVAELSPDGNVTLLAGHLMLTELATFDSGMHLIGAQTATFASRGPVAVADLVYAYTPDQSGKLFTGHTEQSLMALLSNDRPAPEGVWKYLDRDNDERYARLGGDYKLAIVPSATGEGFDIIYLDGAKVKGSLWKPGMLKGRLTPTVFTGQYNLVWYDSHMRPIHREASASVQQGAILTLSFPLYKTTLRFSREPITPPLTDK